VPAASTIADRLLQGDRSIAAELAMGLLKPQRDNLVERPWGGDKLGAFKSVSVPANRRFGESFEISADDGDDEARLHPSVLELADGSTITLPALLAVHADALLGEAFVRLYGRRFPLLEGSRSGGAARDARCRNLNQVQPVAITKYAAETSTALTRSPPEIAATTRITRARTAWRIADPR